MLSEWMARDGAKRQPENMPMSDWPHDIDACVSCTGSAERYRHGARGRCVRCDGIMRYVSQVKAWDINRPETLKRISKPYRSSTDAEQFEKVRDEYIRQLEERLVLLRQREWIRRCEFPVRGLDIEDKLKELLRVCGVPRRERTKYPQKASHINSHFNDAQRRILYALLEEVIELVPWRGVDPNLVADRSSRSPRPRSLAPLS